MMSSLEVVDGHAHPARHVIQSDIPMGLYVPKVHKAVIVGGAVVTRQEKPAGHGVQDWRKDDDVTNINTEVK